MDLTTKISAKMKTLIFGGAVIGLVSGMLLSLQLFEIVFNAWWMDFIVGSAILFIGGTVLDHQVDEALAKAKAGAPAPLPSAPQEPMVLAICPQCKSRIPPESKFCLECGTNLQPKKTA
jgi:ribosomal protein L40E